MWLQFIASYKAVSFLEPATGIHFKKRFVVLHLSVTPTAVMWLTKEIVWHLLNYWCTECDWLTCCWPATTTGMHLVWKVPPTNTLAHTSSGYLGGTPAIINLIVWWEKEDKEEGKKMNIWIQKVASSLQCIKEKYVLFSRCGLFHSACNVIGD